MVGIVFLMNEQRVNISSEIPSPQPSGRGSERLPARESSGASKRTWDPPGGTYFLSRRERKLDFSTRLYETLQGGRLV